VIATLKVVALDGPAGSGKSTVAKMVADRLGFTHIDTGAMFRALTLRAVKAGISVDDEPVVSKIVSGATIDLEDGKVMLDGHDVTAEIRTGKVTRHVSRIASYPAVRGALLARQREFARRCDGIVMEGRDIGTVVFPDARWKFFLDGRPEIRAKRRQEELAAQGRPKDIAWVLADILARDKEDSERPIAPLKKAGDASIIDTSDLSIDDVVDRIVRIVEGTASA
jgi:cytidylate kinase